MASRPPMQPTDPHQRPTLDRDRASTPRHGEQDRSGRRLGGPFGRREVDPDAAANRRRLLITGSLTTVAMIGAAAVVVVGSRQSSTPRAIVQSTIAAVPFDTIAPVVAVPSDPSVSQPSTATGAVITGESVVYQGAFGAGWSDYGWSRRTVGAGPIEVDMTGFGGVIIGFAAGPAELPRDSFVALEFDFAAPDNITGDFMYVSLEDGAETPFPEQRAGFPEPGPGGFRRVRVKMEDLNPTNKPFDRIVFRGARPLDPDTKIKIEGVRFLTGTKAKSAQPSVTVTQDAASLAAAAAANPIRMTLDCTTQFPIDQRIYGIAYDANADFFKRSDQQWTMGATTRRWGGNPTSRYNWQEGNAWNTAADYFWRNVDIRDGVSSAANAFLADNRSRKVSSALSVPMLGWVAKDISSYSFPVSEYGEQKSVDPENADIGDGVGKDNKKIRPGTPDRTSIEAPPSFIGEWISSLVAAAPNGSGSPVDHYILDNEPDLWHETHRDVRSEPLGYDELLQRSIDYGAAIKQADPNAKIAGPASWGWPGYFYSAVDAKAGFSAKPDRRAHDNKALIPWYLEQMRAYEEESGQRLLDILDIHYYPAGKGLYGAAGGGDVTSEGAARRIRAVRSLWDPSYRDESWVDANVNLIPRMKKWIDENYPGTGLQIGEWSFGADTHMSGGLATAEALGRFGTNGVRSAYYWTIPKADGPTYWAFRAFRDPDATDLRFLDTGIKATVSDPGTFGDLLGDGGASVFGSIDPSTGEVVAVVLNTSPRQAARATLVLQGCATPRTVERITYTGQASGFAPGTARTRGDAVVADLPPYSISVVRIR
jgi:hypothetical protein